MSVRILTGDCRDVLRTLPDQSVHCVVTSPPYWGLRDYGVDGQIGLEPSPDEYVAEMVGVFREVHRVLRNDGTLWLNLGDSYASSWPCNRRNIVGNGSLPNGKREARPPRMGGNLKEKDLIGIPWRVAFALQADGWYLRQDIIWSKPNPMPESVTDRCTKGHEYIFLLSKSARYYFDQEAISEPCSPSTHARLSQDVQNQIGSERAHAGGKTNGNMKAVGRASWNGSTFDGPRDLAVRPNTGRKPRASGVQHKQIAIGNHQGGYLGSNDPFETRNKRSVWEIATQPFSEAHFATFPPALIEPCILAGSPKGGTILDPFGGAGTTGLVADRLGRDAILIELNPTYAAMATNRVSDDCPMFASVTA